MLSAVQWDDVEAKLIEARGLITPPKFLPKWNPEFRKRSRKAKFRKILSDLLKDQLPTPIIKAHIGLALKGDSNTKQFADLSQAILQVSLARNREILGR
jgi:hypothetical protein